MCLCLLNHTALCSQLKSQQDWRNQHSQSTHSLVWMLWALINGFHLCQDLQGEDNWQLAMPCSTCLRPFSHSLSAGPRKSPCSFQLSKMEEITLLLHKEKRVMCFQDMGTWFSFHWGWLHNTQNSSHIQRNRQLEKLCSCSQRRDTGQLHCCWIWHKWCQSEQAG